MTRFAIPVAVLAIAAMTYPSGTPQPPTDTPSDRYITDVQGSFNTRFDLTFNTGEHETVPGYPDQWRQCEYDTDTQRELWMCRGDAAGTLVTLGKMRDSLRHIGGGR